MGVGEEGLDDSGRRSGGAVEGVDDLEFGFGFEVRDVFFRGEAAGFEVVGVA